jgi:hypothetical protein
VQERSTVNVAIGQLNAAGNGIHCNWQLATGSCCIAKAPTFALLPRSTTLMISRAFWSQIRAVVRYLCSKVKSHDSVSVTE